MITLVIAALLAAPIANLNLRDGRTLHHVQIVSYARSAVMAKWDGGRGTIAYELFPSEYASELATNRPAATMPPTAATKPEPKARVVTAPAPAAAQTHEVRGQVYVQTLGRGAYKFAETKVRAYPLTQFQHLQTTAENSLPTGYRVHSPVERQAEAIDAWINALREVPVAAEATTDAEGRFSLTLPPGDYFVFCGAFRIAGLTKEWNLWVQAVPASGDLLLNGANEWVSP